MNIYFCSTSYHLYLTILSIDKCKKNVLFWDTTRKVNKNFYIVLSEIIEYWFDEVVIVGFEDRRNDSFGNIIRYFKSRKFLHRYVSLISSHEEISLFVHTLNLLERRIVNYSFKKNIQVNLVEDGLGSYLSIYEVFGLKKSFFLSLNEFIKLILKIRITTDKISNFNVWNTSLLDDELKNEFKDRIQDININNENKLLLKIQLAKTIIPEIVVNKGLFFFKNTPNENIDFLSKYEPTVKSNPEILNYNESINSFDIDFVPWEFYLLYWENSVLLISKNSTVGYSFLFSNVNAKSLILKNTENPIDDISTRINEFFDKLATIYPDSIFIISNSHDLKTTIDNFNFSRHKHVSITGR